MSWEGQILCCYDIITMPGASPRGGGGPGSRSRPGSIPFGGMGASSMSFNDTLQVTVESERASIIFFTRGECVCYFSRLPKFVCFALVRLSILLFPFYFCFFYFVIQDLQSRRPPSNQTSLYPLLEGTPL